MARTPKRSNLKPPGRCIFCGSLGVSKEHIWPQWSFKYVPKGENTRHTRGIFVSSNASPKIRGAREVRQHNGTVSTIQLKVVCERHCNNGWMSTLETRVKPILTPLMLGQPVVLSTADQRTLAKWFAMKVMVAEFSDPRDVSSPQSERDYLMSNEGPPPNWQIWIAHRRGPDWRVKYTRTALTLGVSVDGGLIEAPDNSLAKNSKAVTMGIGELLLHAIATPAGIGVQFDQNLTRQLSQIWPNSNGFLWPPGHILNDAGCDVVASALDRFSLTLPWRAGTPHDKPGPA